MRDKLEQMKIEMENIKEKLDTLRTEKEKNIDEGELTVNLGKTKEDDYGDKMLCLTSIINGSRVDAVIRALDSYNQVLQYALFLALCISLFQLRPSP